MSARIQLKILLWMLILAPSYCFGYGLGVSAHPLPNKANVFTTEFTSFVADGRGNGMQARYLKKLNERTMVEGGLGFSDSERSNRLFVSADMEFFPDYGKQPRVGLKGFIENAYEFGQRKNILGIAPMVSKVFPLWGGQINPFLAMPFGLTLNKSNSTYDLRTTVALGVTGPMKVGDNKRLIYSVEGNFNVQNSFSALYFGLSYSLK